MQQDYTEIELSLQQHERKRKRMQQYAEEATKEQADLLGRSYAQYPWVHPEIVASLVLFGNDSLLSEVAKVSAKETMRSGRTIHTARSGFRGKRTIPVTVKQNGY